MAILVVAGAGAEEQPNFPVRDVTCLIQCDDALDEFLPSIVRYDFTERPARAVDQNFRAILAVADDDVGHDANAFDRDADVVWRSLFCRLAFGEGRNIRDGCSGSGARTNAAGLCCLSDRRRPCSSATGHAALDARRVIHDCNASERTVVDENPLTSL